MKPTEIRLAADRASLEIAWDDGAIRRLDAATLRAHCRSAAAVRSMAEGRAPEMTDRPRIVSIEPVGGYAVNLAFSDGEERGIYPWPLLRSLGA